MAACSFSLAAKRHIHSQSQRLTYRSVSILIYGWAIYQSRLTRISARDGTSFDVLAGPLLICCALFVAILANFIFRAQEAQKQSGLHPLAFAKVWEHAGSRGLWAPGSL